MLSSQAEDTAAYLAITAGSPKSVTVVADHEEGVLVVTRGPDVGSRIPLGDGPVKAGRHPDSDLFLDDVTVSRRHAEVIRNGEGYELVDLGSLNGTYVNQQRIERVVLRDGDEVQIGKFKLVFHVGTGRKT